jgi:hypothetical protein
VRDRRQRPTDLASVAEQLSYLAEVDEAMHLDPGEALVELVRGIYPRQYFMLVRVVLSRDGGRDTMSPLCRS